MSRAVRHGAVVLACALLAIATHAGAGLNVAVGERAYDDLEYLQVKGLLPAAMLSTRPIGRKEASIHASGARQACRDRSQGCSAAALAAIDLLTESYGIEDGHSYFKPFGRPYLKAAYTGTDPYFAEINNNGDEFTGNLAARAGFSVEAGALEALHLHINPEFRLDGGSARGELLRGYLSLDIGPVELQAGRDSLWWGSARHGALLLSNNAAPFDMLKLGTSRPVTLPWLFSGLGLFKPTVFVARLEEDRDFPRANLLGMRLDFKPTAGFQFGLSRVFMFGGEGRRSLTASDWVKAFFASDSAEHQMSPTNGNQLAMVDASFVYVNRGGLLPFSGIKAYTEWGAEDSSGTTKTPSNRANIYGVYIDEPARLTNVDLRVEWANTARHGASTLKWYTHTLYRTGYTFEGRLIGHHMGGDSRDLFVRAQYHAPEGSVLGVEADRQWTGVHSSVKGRRDWLAADFRTRAWSVDWLAQAGYEKIDDASGSRGNAAATLRAEMLF